MPERCVEDHELRLSFLELLGYLAASAHGAVTSSKLYGPLRLLEAAERLIHLMDTLGLADDDLRDLAQRITTGAMTISTDPDRCRAFADEATLLLAHKLKQTGESSPP